MPHPRRLACRVHWPNLIIQAGSVATVVVYLLVSLSHELSSRTLVERHGERPTPLAPHRVAYAITALVVLRVLLVSLCASSLPVPLGVASMFGVALALQIGSLISFARGSMGVALALMLLFATALELAHAHLGAAIEVEGDGPARGPAFVAALRTVARTYELSGPAPRVFAASLAGYATWGWYNAAILAAQVAAPYFSEGEMVGLASTLVVQISTLVAAGAIVADSGARLPSALWSLSTILARQENGAWPGVLPGLYASLVVTGVASIAVLLRGCARKG